MIQIEGWKYVSDSCKKNVTLTSNEMLGQGFHVYAKKKEVHTLGCYSR